MCLRCCLFCLFSRMVSLSSLLCRQDPEEAVLLAVTFYHYHLSSFSFFQKQFKNLLKTTDFKSVTLNGGCGDDYFHIYSISRSFYLNEEHFSVCHILLKCEILFLLYVLKNLSTPLSKNIAISTFLREQQYYQYHLSVLSTQCECIFITFTIVIAVKLKSVFMHSIQ